MITDFFKMINEQFIKSDPVQNDIAVAKHWYNRLRQFVFDKTGW